MRVEVEVVLLDVLAVVALAVGQAEEPLLEDRILAVPQRQREAEPLLVVGDAGQPVLAPAVGARAGLVVAEVVPGVARLAVVLAHRAPLPLAEVRSPLPPGHSLLARRRQPIQLRCPGLTRHWRLLYARRRPESHDSACRVREDEGLGRSPAPATSSSNSCRVVTASGIWLPAPGFAAWSHGPALGCEPSLPAAAQLGDCPDQAVRVRVLHRALDENIGRSHRFAIVRLVQGGANARDRAVD